MAVQSSWAPEVDLSLLEEGMVELVGMLEEYKIDEEEVRASPPPAASKAATSGAPAPSAASAVGADAVDLTSKFTALRWPASAEANWWLCFVYCFKFDVGPSKLIHINT